MTRLRDIGPEMFRLYDAGRYGDALSVVEDALDALPEDDRPTAAFWRMCLLSRTGQLDAATAELRSALGRGWWYGREALRDDEDLAPLHGDERWEPLVAESLHREAAARDSDPEGEFHSATRPEPKGSVVGLHAAAGRVRQTAAILSAVTDLGYDLHVPGSTQRVSHDRASWTDRDVAYRDVVSRVRPELRTDRVIMIGRSQGAARAAEFASRRDLPIVGVVMVASAPSIGDAPDVTVPTYVVAGERDRVQYLERIEAFRDHQESRSVPIHVERLATMGHLYPDPFTSHLEAAIGWLETNT